MLFEKYRMGSELMHTTVLLWPQDFTRQTDYPFHGLRYPVETLLELFSVGMSLEEILNDYENLEREDLRVALAYAARFSKVKRIETTL